ncbi:SIMPL domain-containing protein [Phenylobacterium soli]|uniref:SIMPL domain-containing protein n=1 Tax=Phenylobacterium soli TaxID=2170551 RepID=A0A328AK89_9CAUL|nr:SIMPL domain-containing protein [Phenylobacterium soli]RAK55312.1 SIMPL domain-containing protein [Phenylobacterium soli]
MADRQLLLGISAAALVAVGLVAGGALVGRSLEHFRTADRTVTVRGLSERIVKADMAVLPIPFAAAGDSLDAVQSKIDADVATVRRFLTAQGFKPDEIDLGKLEVSDRFAQEYQPNQPQARYRVAQTVIVRSTNVDLVQAATRRLDALVRGGVVLQNYQGPSYLFTRLNDVRPAMIAEATASARSGAQQFAHDSGSALGLIREATQGSFEILGRDEIGYDANAQVFKKVRVVTTVRYQLR